MKYDVLTAHPHWQDLIKDKRCSLTVASKEFKEGIAARKKYLHDEHCISYTICFHDVYLHEWVVGGCWLLFMLATYPHQLTTCEGAADGRVNLLGEAIPLESEEEIAEAKKFLGDFDCYVRIVLVLVSVSICFNNEFSNFTTFCKL